MIWAIAIILGIIGAIIILDLQRMGKMQERMEQRYIGIKTGETNTSKYKYVHDPNSGYTDMGLPYFGGKSILDKLDDRLEVLRVRDEWRDIKDTTLQFLQELTALQPGKWEGKLAEQEAFVSDMNDSFMEALKGLSGWIDLGYKAMEKPGVKVDPAYRAAFEAKVQEAKDFIATAGQRR